MPQLIIYPLVNTTSINNPDSSIDSLVEVSEDDQISTDPYFAAEEE